MGVSKREAAGGANAYRFEMEGVVHILREVDNSIIITESFEKKTTPTFSSEYAHEPK